MKDFKLTGSDKTPHFTLNSNGDIRFGGVSMPEDAASFYYDIMDWISDYYREPNSKTVVTVNFRYLNSSSSSMVFKIFDALKRLQATGKSIVRCSWYYEEADESMLDYIERIKDHADNIEFEILTTDNVFEN